VNQVKGIAMSNIEQYFNQMAESLRAQGAEIVPGDRSWRIVAGDDVVTVAFGDDTGELVCHATVGSFANVSEKGLFLEDALKANCFWNETNGATLSVEPETDDLVLAEHRAVAFVDSAAGLEFFFSQFFGTLRKWKRYIADCSPAGVPEAQSSTDDMGSVVFPAPEAEMRFVP